MVEIVQAQANDLAWLGHQRRQRNAGQAVACGLRGDSGAGGCRQIDTRLERRTQVRRHAGVGVMQVNEVGAVEGCQAGYAIA